ncbi:hypothetical protein HY994_06445 [Candidatus Micrarchaeota archaeon]|nr:hypothetical protein [Candidatus Micrarchaeota archaeon]
MLQTQLGINHLPDTYAKHLENPTVLFGNIQKMIDKKGKISFFDVFDKPKSGGWFQRKHDINAIKLYYSLRNGKELKTVEMANGHNIEIDKLSSEHAHKIRAAIENELSNGRKLTDIGFLNVYRPNDFKKTGKASQYPGPKASRMQWIAAGAAVAGGMALGANYFGTKMVEDRYSTAPTAVVQPQAIQQHSRISLAQTAVKNYYKNPHNHGVDTVKLTHEWLNHRNRIGANAGEIQAKDFVRQWNDYSRKVGARKAVLSRTDLIAFLKSRTQGGMPELARIADAALKIR